MFFSAYNLASGIVVLHYIFQNYFSFISFVYLTYIFGIVKNSQGHPLLFYVRGFNSDIFLIADAILTTTSVASQVPISEMNQ